MATSPASVHLFSSPFCFLSQLLPQKSVVAESGSALHLILVTVYNVFMLGFRMTSFIKFQNRTTLKYVLCFLSTLLVFSHPVPPEIFSFSLFMCKYVSSACMSVHLECLVPGSEEGVRSFGTELIDSSESPYECWELNPGPGQKKPVLLNARSLFQFHLRF